MFGDLEMSIEEIEKLVGKPINGINMTPMTLMSGTLVGLLLPGHEEHYGTGCFILMTSKEFVASEELIASRGVLTIEEFCKEYLGYEDTEKMLEYIDKNGELVIDVKDESMKWDLRLTRHIIETMQIIVMPFSNALSVESEMPAQTK